MRFAFKTAPQHTTWADMLAVWQAADDIEVFESTPAVLEPLAAALSELRQAG